MAVATALAEPTSTARPRARPGVSAAPNMSPEELLRRALSVIELSADGVTCCTNCGGTDLGRWGKSRRALQRWRCRDCERSCTAATGTALARVHSLDKLHAVAVDMLGPAPASCRKLAATLGLDRMTVWRWRKLIAAAWADHKATIDAATTLPSDTVTLRESRKASREWVRHQRDPERYPAPDRLRWIDYRTLELPLPEPMARYRVELRFDAPSCHEVEGRADCDACPVPVDARARQSEAVETGGVHADHRAGVDLRGRTAFHACPAGSAADRPSMGHAERVISLVEPFRHFMKPFRGPATRHLQTYRAWFVARLQGPAPR